MIDDYLQTGIPGLLANIEKGCREYEEYMKLDEQDRSKAPVRSPEEFCAASIASL